MPEAPHAIHRSKEECNRSLCRYSPTPPPALPGARKPGLIPGVLPDHGGRANDGGGGVSFTAEAINADPGTGSQLRRTPRRQESIYGPEDLHLPAPAAAEGTDEHRAAYSRQANLTTRPAVADPHKQARQEAGIAVLIGIAAQVSLAMSEASTAIIPAVPPCPVPNPAIEEISPEVAEVQPRVTADDRRTPLASLYERLREDHLVRNSLYLILSSGVQAALGFAFWVVMARLFSPEDVGKASSLISAAGLISLLALFGLNNTLVRFLPTATDRNALITGAFLLVAACGAGFALLYLLMTPVIAPRLAFMAHQPTLEAGFALLTAGVAVNVLTDSVFIASRKASYCALTDGGVGGISKIVAGVILAGSGAYGLFCAYASGFVASALVSIALTIIFLRWRPSIRKAFRALRPRLRFSGANYAASISVLMPSLVVPLIVLDRLGAHAAAYYFVAFQMAALVYAAVYAVESSFLAEGSYSEQDWRKIRRRSRRLAVILFLPGCIVLTVTAHWVLLVFGAEYSKQGTPSLILLAVAVIPIAATNWSWTVLRLTDRLHALIFSSSVYAVAICGLAWFLAPHGLTALTAAWPIGASCAAAVATVATVARSAKAPPRHRRTSRTSSPPSLSAAGSSTTPAGPSASSSRPPAATAPSRSRQAPTSSPPPTPSPTTSARPSKRSTTPAGLHTKLSQLR